MIPLLESLVASWIRCPSFSAIPDGVIIYFATSVILSFGKHYSPGRLLAWALLVPGQAGRHSSKCLEPELICWKMIGWKLVCMLPRKREFLPMPIPHELLKAAIAGLSNASLLAMKNHCGIAESPSRTD